MSMTFDRAAAGAIPLIVVTPEGLEHHRARLPKAQAAWVAGSGFAAGAGEVVVVPDASGAVACALVGAGTAPARARGRFQIGGARSRLPAGTYRLEGLEGRALEEAALGWLLDGYRFDRYASQKPVLAQLAAPAGVDAGRLEILAASEALTRDLINTPASDMGPDELEAAARGLAEEFGAKLEVTRGDELLAANLPMIHAVGRASDRAPRLIDMRWGKAGPTLTLVGKGVCFDTGGLDIKGAASMGLMKKDMGGAATVLGLARIDHGSGLEAAAAGADPGGRKRHCRQCLPPAGHPDLAQGADGRDQQHRCRGPAGAGRCAGAGGRGNAPIWCCRWRR